MTEERRYDDDEMAEIFNRATKVDASPASRSTSLSSGEGMTLAELQEIGAEAGIDPALVAQAAASLQVGPPETLPRRRFGVAMTVGRTVDLPAKLSDADWDRLVVRLRDLFHARGVVHREGSLRSWSNGNLQVLLEPTASGYRLRMRSLNQNLQARVTGGMLIAVGAQAILAIMVVSSLLGFAGDLVFRELIPLLLAVGMGVYLYRSGSARASWWVGRREAQFEEIGALAVAMAEERARLEAPRDGGGSATD